MATVNISPRQALQETFSDPGKVAEVSKEALAAILRLALRDVSDRTAEEINALLEKALGSNAEAGRQALISDCKITVLGEGKVSLTLPPTMSRVEFLEQVQPLARDLYGRDAIYPACLERCATDKEYTAKRSGAAAVAIGGNVSESNWKTRDEQVALLDKQGLQMPDVCDLAVAHAAYFVATGEDLFRGSVVRARCGVLCFYPVGLVVGVNYCPDDSRSYDIAASASLRAGTE